MMNRRNLGRMAATLAVACSMVPWSAMAADEAPDALIKRLSTEVISMVRDDKASGGYFGGLYGLSDDAGCLSGFQNFVDRKSVV